MIVIERNGKRTVITGWRAWLVFAAVAVLMVVVGFLLLGFALTFFAILMFALPLAILLGLIAMLFQSKP